MVSPLLEHCLLMGQVVEASAFSAAGLVNAAAPLLGLLGVGVILWGAYYALVQQLASEQTGLHARPSAESGPNRVPFSHYLALGLEFMIGAGAIKTLNDHSLEQIAVVGGLVLSRAVVGLYPRWDFKAASAPVALARPAVESPSEPPALPVKDVEAVPSSVPTTESVIANPSVVRMAS